MKAAVCFQYGPPEHLRLVDLPKPVPGEREILVQVMATTVTRGDTIIRGFNVPGPLWQRALARLVLGLRKPRRPVLGMELAGVVEALGRGVTRFKVGDAVLASTFSCGFGAYAEYTCLPESAMVVHKPDNLSFGEAAALVGAGMTALRCLRQGKIVPGQRVLIYGASGAVGTQAVQLARHFGAEVTGVCGPRHMERVRSLGAVHLVDYTQEDFSVNVEPQDVVFDAVDKLSAAQVDRLLLKGGRHLNVRRDSGRGERFEELLFIRNLAKAGRLRPVIERSYPLKRIGEAHRHVETGHKMGSVVITPVQPRRACACAGP